MQTSKSSKNLKLVPEDLYFARCLRYDSVQNAHVLRVRSAFEPNQALTSNKI